MPIKKFRVIYTALAEREISALDFIRSERIVGDITTYLEFNPFPFGKPRIKKLIGFDPPLYRLRSGDFRAYYRIDGDQVIILTVLHKKGCERFLKRNHEEGAAYKKRPQLEKWIFSR